MVSRRFNCKDEERVVVFGFKINLTQNCEAHHRLPSSFRGASNLKPYFECVPAILMMPGPSSQSDRQILIDTTPAPTATRSILFLQRWQQIDVYPETQPSQPLQ